MKYHKGMDWLPIWIDKWLFGSMRQELEPDERSVFLDLLILSAKDNGHIRANEAVPYPYEQLAGMFLISVELLNRTIEKCLKPFKPGQQPKLTKLSDKTLYVTKFPEYQLTGRHKRRLEEKSIKTVCVPMSGKTDTMSGKADPIDRIDEREIDSSKKESISLINTTEKKKEEETGIGSPWQTKWMEEQRKKLEKKNASEASEAIAN